MENWGGERERERKKATAAAPSTCLAAPSGVTNLNGTLCAPIASACLLILTLQRRRRLRLTGFLSATCTASHAPMLPLIMIAFKFRRTGFPSSRDRVFSFARDKIRRLTDQFLAAILFGNRVFLNGHSIEEISRNREVKFDITFVGCIT